MEQATARFFSALYPTGIPEGTRILVWALPDKTSYWCSTPEQAAEESAKQTEAKADVYIGAGLGPTGKGRKDRAKNEQVLAIPGLWADIDYGDEVHKKENLPSRDEALAFLRDEIGAEYAPSFIIHTGHGYHAWWLFDKLWMLPTPGERSEAQEVMRGWTYHLKAAAEKHGWAVDSTFDLARVMRVPGTLNRKREVIPVEIEVDSDGRFDRRSFSHFVGKNTSKVQPDTVKVGDLVLDANAQPPMDKWMALTASDPRVMKTWQRDRKDFTDQSPSSYDMSLASFAVAAAWTDQQITDLLIASRRFNNDDLKLREDYYKRTLTRARGTIEMARVEDAIQEGNPLSRSEKLEALSKLLTVQIHRLVKYVADPPVYVLELSMNGEQRAITLGGIEVLLTQRLFRNQVAAVVNLIIPECNKTQWERRAQALLDAMEEHELGPESTPAGAARSWLEEYLATHKPSEEWQEAVIAGRPYVHENYVHVALRQVSFWLRTVQGERISAKELARFMRMAGYEQYTQWVPPGDSRPATTRSVWRTRL